MAPPIAPDPAEWEQIRRAGRGDGRCLEELFARYLPRLKRMVKLRLDPRVQGRIDPSEVLSHTYLDTCRRLPDYLREPTLPFFLWLREVAGQSLQLAHRQYLGDDAAGVGRELSLYRGALPEAPAAALAAQQKEEFGSATSADARFLTAGKKLIDVRHDAFRKLTAVKTRIGNYWRGVSLPTSSPASASSASPTSSRSSTRWGAPATSWCKPRSTSTPPTARSRRTPAAAWGGCTTPTTTPPGCGACPASRGTSRPSSRPAI
jgi:hypothetical protein